MSALPIIGPMRTRSHAASQERVPLALPPGATVNLFPATVAPEAVMFAMMDSVHRILSIYPEPSGEEVDYTFACVSRAWWRMVSRWRLFE